MVCHKFPWKVISSDIYSVKKRHTGEENQQMNNLYFLVKCRFRDWEEGNASICESQSKCVISKICCAYESAELIINIQDDASQFNKYLCWVLFLQKYVQYSNCSHSAIKLHSHSLCTHLPSLKQTNLPNSFKVRLKVFLSIKFVPQVQLYEYFPLKQFASSKDKHILEGTISSKALRRKEHKIL